MPSSGVSPARGPIRVPNLSAKARRPAALVDSRDRLTPNAWSKAGAPRAAAPVAPLAPGPVRQSVDVRPEQALLAPGHRVQGALAPRVNAAARGRNRLHRAAGGSIVQRRPSPANVRRPVSLGRRGMTGARVARVPEIDLGSLAPLSSRPLLEPSLPPQACNAYPSRHR